LCRSRLGWLVGILLPMIGIAALGIAANAERSIESYEDCDIPAAGYRSLKATDESECARSCSQESKCQAFVFVSGWNRCFLKESSKMVQGIKMYGGDIDRSDSREAVIKSFGALKDHRGKDLKNIAGVKSEESCQQFCVKENMCVGYVWISGYDSCWLKKTKGSALDKRFYCGKINSSK
jgi:hypothetical protein